MNPNHKEIDPKRRKVTQEKIERLKESLKAEPAKDVDPRIIQASKIQIQVLIEDSENSLKE